ncbi:hypothetical protein GIB67_040636 [Kingdonia uniflora]|uniref:ATP-dependent DNA helicase n=1 Tax=Kingdonia uniflora TaxID=39325 RepID=A0A7J7M915_9MAGN|nr:hypothetical protein GIB67_040636 [Kingdonia uniflora]
MANYRGQLFFLNREADTDKTFVYNTISATCRREGDIVIMVTSTGIASLVLDGGRTLHSRFKIPLDVLANSKSRFTKQSI